MKGYAAENIRFSIEVRARPIQGTGSTFATHCFLVLLNASGEVVDSLSFDPSNSIGWSDADPTNVERGSVVMTTDCEYETWSGLRDAFKRWANRSPYVLGHHNCCHVVMGALVSTNLPQAKLGIHFARSANATWHDLNGNPSTKDFYKKNV